MLRSGKCTSPLTFSASGADRLFPEMSPGNPVGMYRTSMRPLHLEQALAPNDSKGREPEQGLFQRDVQHLLLEWSRMQVCHDDTAAKEKAVCRSDSAIL